MCPGKSQSGDSHPSSHRHPNQFDASRPNLRANYCPNHHSSLYLGQNLGDYLASLLGHQSDHVGHRQAGSDDYAADYLGYLADRRTDLGDYYGNHFGYSAEY